MTNREIDVLVAEKVMGFGVVTHGGGYYDLMKTEFFKDVGYNLATGPLPNYSTSIVAAWEIVEKLREKFCVDILNNHKHKGVYVELREFIAGPVDFKHYADTAPMAIAKASLKAVGHEFDG